MPQAELTYSAHLKLDAAALLASAETTIHKADASAGLCKGRALPIAVTHHDHVLLRIRVLEKPHRDAAFMHALLEDLHTTLQPLISSPCELSIELGFQSPYGSSATLTG